MLYTFPKNGYSTSAITHAAHDGGKVMELDPTKTRKKKRGRPPKYGAKDPKHFGRALEIVHAYMEAREKCPKHSTAVREAVEFVRRSNPRTRVSESEVKRVLAEFMPHSSSIALKVDLSVLEGDEAARRRSRLALMLGSAGDKSAAQLIGENLRKPFKTLKFGFEKKTQYPRINSKTSKD
jgi:hypothetical protein